MMKQRVGDHLHVLDPAIRHDQPMFHFDQALLARGLLQNTIENGQVIGMSASPDHCQRRCFVQRVFKNARSFVRPRNDDFVIDGEADTAGVTEFLCAQEERLFAAQ
ncbi:hypothetical protein D3C75_1134400 [compost metagenome]